MAAFNVPVLIQAKDDFEVDGSTRVEVRNVAVPRISPDSLMVSDYPERLTENGTLFTADLRVQQPSRFLYFHYNPPGQPDCRIVLRARESLERTVDRASHQRPRGACRPTRWRPGDVATKRFLVDVEQNQGRLLHLGRQHLRKHRTARSSGGKHRLQPVAAPRALGRKRPSYARRAGRVRRSVRRDRRQRTLGKHHTNTPAASTRLRSSILRPFGGSTPTTWSFRSANFRCQTICGVRRSREIMASCNPLWSTSIIHSRPRRRRHLRESARRPATGTYIIDGVLVQSHQVPPSRDIRYGNTWFPRTASFALRS